LKLFGRNPRQGDVGALVESLRYHGQYRPIVVNSRTSEVLAGNHTLMAAVELGWQEIAATYVDVDEDQAARIVLIDNRANDLASYDDGALAALLEDLPSFDGTGYDGDELDALLAQANEVLPPPESGDAYKEQFGVIVICDSEARQAEVFAQLVALGLECKVVTT